LRDRGGPVGAVERRDKGKGSVLVDLLGEECDGDVVTGQKVHADVDERKECPVTRERRGTDTNRLDGLSHATHSVDEVGSYRGPALSENSPLRLRWKA
jgi:hypothetical protein